MSFLKYFELILVHFANNQSLLSDGRSVGLHVRWLVGLLDSLLVGRLVGLQVYRSVKLFGLDLRFSCTVDHCKVDLWSVTKNRNQQAVIQHNLDVFID